MTDTKSNGADRVNEPATPTNSSPQFQQKQVISGRYEVISRLGAGGMGLVYRVRQILLNKEFALKTIDKRCMSEIAIRRFQQEARTAFALNHPNIIAVNDFGCLDDETPFLVMELLNGETLGERIHRLGTIPWEQAIPIFVQVCFGLAYAHECGVIHRDIKPNNIMLIKALPLGTEGSVKILDFGIAKFIQHEGGEMQALTRTGEIFGSPLYMSPEQCSGELVDQRSDIYSLGCVFFEALTGAPPCVGENALATMMKHQSEKALTLKEASLGTNFPEALEKIVATMLAKSPSERYQNLGAVANDLGALRRGDSISATAASTKIVSAANSISMQRSSFYALIAAVAILSAAISAVCVYFFSSASGRPSTDHSEAASTENKSDISGKLAPVPVHQADDAGYEVISASELKRRLGEITPTRKFVLHNEKLTGESLLLIAATPWIKDLGLPGCDIANESLGCLDKMHLNQIDLSGSTFNDEGAAIISSFKGLPELHASSTDLSDKGVSKLATIDGLQSLYIARSHITAKSLEALSKANNLVNLDIGETKITSNDLASLIKSKLHQLDLRDTPVDDAGMAYVSKLNSLKIVILDRTKVTVDGLTELCKKSKSCRTIILQVGPYLGTEALERLRKSFPSIAFINQTPKRIATDIMTP